MPARPLLALCVAVLSLAALTGCGASTPTATPATAGTPTVRLAGTSLTGGQVRVPADGARVTVVNLWASWCGPCQQEAPALAAAHRQLSGAPVAFVGLDERDKDAAGRQFAAAHNWTYPMLADPVGELAAKIPGVPPSALPVTVVLDSTGAVTWKHVGAVTTAEVVAAATTA